MCVCVVPDGVFVWQFLFFVWQFLFPLWYDLRRCNFSFSIIETLGKELGLYEHPTDQMGQLSMEALRSCRLVVDTGMHAMGWSRDDAVQYMLKNTAMGDHDAQTEVTRYITWPGQATAYKVGERYIRRLRTMAETELRDQFDPRDFYDVVLLCGPVPLTVLEELVQEYIHRILAQIGNTPLEGGDIREDQTRSNEADNNISSILDTMTFANWCKCCVVPGACQV